MSLSANAVARRFLPAAFGRWISRALMAGVILIALPGASGEAPAQLVRVPTGVHRPLFRGPDDFKEVAVESFLLSDAPVTNGEFLEFVRANPQWRRSTVRRLFADASYLRHWAGDLELGDEALERSREPVVNVSWFAAKAYASWRGMRLPSTAEWELAAAAGYTRLDGENDGEFMRDVARWYGTPAPARLPAVRGGRPNLFGAHDLHGLVWEWTSDFNSALATGDARGDTGLERQLFCGAGSLGASDRANFPAFMRAGLRSSLRANYTLHNLGFRCAANLPASPPHAPISNVSHPPSP